MVGRYAQEKSCCSFFKRYSCIGTYLLKLYKHDRCCSVLVRAREQRPIDECLPGERTHLELRVRLCKSPMTFDGIWAHAYILGGTHMFVMWHSHSFVGQFSFHLMRFQKMQVSLGEKRAHKGLAPTPC